MHCLIITAQCTAAVYFLVLDKKNIILGGSLHPHIRYALLFFSFSFFLGAGGGVTSGGNDPCGHGLSNHPIHIESKLDSQLMVCRPLAYDHA